ncbi:MAG: anaphase-promoting complex subunit cdc27 [Bogoriella megaspora]|nr:MAG: anaphase-promoting complex subunit cdc27 [Bogoriella megaspora]
MSRSNPHIASQLRQLIFYHLDNEYTENALFMAERLQALEPRSPDAAHLLSLCNLRLRRFKAAYDQSHRYGNSGRHLACAYVFAQACLALKLYAEGLIALQKAKHLRGTESYWSKPSETAKRYIPDAAAILCLSGKLYRCRREIDKATDCFVETLKLNPFMWDAFTSLCDMGVSVQPANVFKLPPEMLAVISMQQQSDERRGEEAQPQTGPLAHQSSNAHNQILTPSGDPFNPTTRTANVTIAKHSSNAFFSKISGVSRVPTDLPEHRHPSHAMNETPTAGRDDNDVMINAPEPYRPREAPEAPARKLRTLYEQRGDSSLDARRQRLPSDRSRSQAEPESTGANHGADTTNNLKPVNNNHKRTISGHSAQSSTSSSTDPTTLPQRRSTRLLNTIRPSSSRPASSETLVSKDGREIKKARGSSTKGKTTSTVGRVVSGNRKPMEKSDQSLKEGRSLTSNPNFQLPQNVPTRPPPPEVPPSQEALNWLMDLFLRLGNGYFCLSRYECTDAIRHFNSITQPQRDTAWVIAQLGRALHEASSHKEAAEMFSRLHKIAPYRVEDTELYTTILWHLKSHVELAWLARELLDVDPHSPQAWCAIGNAWSLEREHDQAIKCFKRATQLDPAFAYAYTLEGHEHVENEDFDKATECYRTAIERDLRAYSAWYGLGKVHEKIGKYADAEKYYTMASKINVANPLLVVYVGVVLEKQGKLDRALECYELASKKDTRSSEARFRKARVLLHKRMPKLALEELAVLKDIAPDAANVHFLLGKTYKAISRKNDAIKHFTTAMNLDPKATPYIKEAMESFEDDEYEEDDLAEGAMDSEVY